MKHLFIPICIILFAVTSILSYGEELPNVDPNDSDAQWQWFHQELEKYGGVDTGESPIEFTAHCRVVDQNGDPVPGAEVKVSWMSDRLINFVQQVDEVALATDANGNFNFTAVKEKLPRVASLSKKGYEYLETMNLFFDQDLESQLQGYMNSTSENPLLLYSRKMEVPTYLYHEELFGWHFTTNVSIVSYTILKRGLETIDSDVSLIKNPDKVDLVFHVEQDLQNNHYNFKIIAPLATNGVLLDDNELYTAPAEGYSSEVVITLNHDEEMEKYLYFKSRNLEYETQTGKEHKPIYSRMKLEFKALEDRLIFYYDTWTNPYGSPNLEYEPDMPADLHVYLTDQAEEAIKSGKLPPEPNLQEMMASGQYN